MDVLQVVAPVFALIVLGYIASWGRLLSESAHKGLAEFAFGIAVPALMLRMIATASFPNVSPARVWGAYFGAVMVTWIVATICGRYVLRRPASEGVTISMAAVYGNIVMLGIPLAYLVFGPDSAGAMALILSINTPVLWLAGTLQIGVADRRGGAGLGTRIASLGAELIRNPIVLGILGGVLLRFADVRLHPVADKTLALVAQAGVPMSLVALGAGLRRFRVEGQVPTLRVMCVLKLLLMPGVAWWLAFGVFDLPGVEGGVVVLFAAMPAGANVYLFASRYGALVDSASGAIALGTLASAFTLSAVIGVLLQMPK